jgi:Ca2+-binding EF-hand superfamily protein
MSARLSPGVAIVFLAAVTALGLPEVSLADPPSATDVISKYDSDKDKSLDLNEVKAAASAHFDRLNKDGDSTLEVSEVKGVLGPKAFKAADTDHDGTLSKDEYLALVEKLFKEADADHDGTLNAAELQSRAGKALVRLIN